MAATANPPAAIKVLRVVIDSLPRLFLCAAGAYLASATHIDRRPAACYSSGDMMT
jgi:hypothetical protein